MLSLIMKPFASTRYGLNPNNTYINYVLEAQVTLYCYFRFDGYPMDAQTCEFYLTHSNRGNTMAFSLDQDQVLLANSNTFALQNFIVGFKSFQLVPNPNNTLEYVDVKDVQLNFSSNYIGVMDVGFNITLTRYLQPFILKYYMPGITIVAASQISFLIPLAALPGRIALLATLFLSLTNIITAQEVG